MRAISKRVEEMLFEMKSKYCTKAIYSSTTRHGTRHQSRANQKPKPKHITANTHRPRAHTEHIIVKRQKYDSFVVVVVVVVDVVVVSLSIQLCYALMCVRVCVCARIIEVCSRRYFFKKIYYRNEYLNERK